MSEWPNSKGICPFFLYVRPDITPNISSRTIHRTVKITQTVLLICWVDKDQYKKPGTSMSYANILMRLGHMLMYFLFRLTYMEKSSFSIPQELLSEYTM